MPICRTCRECPPDRLQARYPTLDRLTARHDHRPAVVAVGHFDTVVLDCPDPLALAEFYAGLLGQDTAEDGDDSWQSLRGDGSGVSLAFQRATNYIAPHWPEGLRNSFIST